MDLADDCRLQMDDVCFLIHCRGTSDRILLRFRLLLAMGAKVNLGISSRRGHTIMSLAKSWL